VSANQPVYIQIILILQLAPCGRSAPRGLPIMTIQSCIFIPAVPEGWHKSEQSPARKPALLQAVVDLASTGGTGGEASLPG